MEHISASLIVAGVVALVVVALIVALAFCAKCKVAIDGALTELVDLLEHPIDFAFRSWAFFGPRIMNRNLWGALGMDGTINSIDVLRGYFAHNPMAFAALVAFNLLTTLKPPGAPDKFPAPGMFQRSRATRTFVAEGRELGAGA